jgi:hypothetical protein
MFLLAMVDRASVIFHTTSARLSTFDSSLPKLRCLDFAKAGFYQTSFAADCFSISCFSCGIPEQSSENHNLDSNNNDLLMLPGMSTDFLDCLHRNSSDCTKNRMFAENIMKKRFHESDDQMITYQININGKVGPSAENFINDTGRSIFLDNCELHKEHFQELTNRLQTYENWPSHYLALVV